MKIHSQKGNSIVVMPLVIAIMFFIFAIFSIIFVNILKPFVVYEKLSSTSLKYIFVLEEYGYLTKKEREKMINDLVEKGLKKEKITLRATSEEKDYGDPVSLILSYDCNVRIPTFGTSFLPTMENKNIEVKVSKYSFCKR